MILDCLMHFYVAVVRFDKVNLLYKCEHLLEL